MNIAAATRSARAPLLSPGQLRIVVLLGLMLVWEILPRLGLVSLVILSPLSATLMVAVDEPGIFAAALAVTLAEIAVGLVIAYVGGGTIGLLVGSIKPVRAALLPVISSIYAVPFVVIYPIMTAWLGIGPESKVWFGGLYGLFPMALASAAGVQLVDKRLITAAQSMGASRLQIITQVMIPAALPAMIAGLRLGGALVTIGVIVAEMLASTDGIGFLITQNRTMFRTPEVYFGIILVLIVAGGLDATIGYVERRFTYTNRNRS